MADRHPYFQTPGQFVQLVNHLRQSFPSSITAETIKKLGLAPKNESYLVNALRSLGLIDAEGKKTDVAGKIFSLHQDEAFQKELASIIKKTYSQLFELHAEGTWALDTNKLISFFRQTDQSSAAVGKFQATAFKTLAGLSGHGETPEPRQKQGAAGIKATASKKVITRTPKNIQSGERIIGGTADSSTQRNVGLTVRVEINLPAEGDQQTYDRIFKSIRENLLNG